MRNGLVTAIFLIIAFTTFAQSNRGAALHNNFALRIYKASISDTSNFFMSPLSLRIALLAAGEGAAGDTRRYFNDLVVMDDLSNVKKLIRDLSGKGDNNFFEAPESLEIANAIWANETVHFKTAFLDILRNDYQSEYFSFDPKNMATVARDINNWVSEKTHGKITDAPAPSPTSTLAILNAIYFRDSWSVPFKKRKTKERTFHTITGANEKKSFMYNQTTFSYFENSSMQALRLPYRSGYEMVVMLPLKRDGLKDLEQTIDTTLMRDIVRNSSWHPVTVYLPKFNIKSELDMSSAMADHGYAELLSPGADFSGMSDNGNFSIGSIIHKTFIEVSEKETEAAAITEIVITGYGGGETPPPPQPKLFNANHPFLFLIVDKRTGSIIFAGRYVK